MPHHGLHRAGFSDAAIGDGLVAVVRLFGAAHLIRGAGSAIDHAAATVADRAALGAELTARLGHAAAVVRDATPAARLGGRARAAMQHPTASIGSVAAVEPKRLARLRRALAGATLVR